jgi:16S rRNA C967 or C1407 C5-methylase (RsmB/RsmF family)
MSELPLAFIRQTQPLLGGDWEAFASSMADETPVSIRLNDKIHSEILHTPVPWCPTGYYLPNRPSFTSDPLFHAGAYYVQEAGSMFIGQIITQHINKPVTALDLCAAPGGKSTHLSSLLPDGSLLVSNEVVRGRAKILIENSYKWGNSDVVITNNEAASIGKLRSFFDFMLIDAPCSGEGMFRKDPGAIAEWSPENVKLCALRQQSIVTDVWPALKEGGLLIYSTCTYNRSENEDNVRFIIENMGAELVEINTQPEWNITKTDYGYRFMPHKTRAEGFFISLLRKTASESPFRARKDKKATDKTPTHLPVKQLSDYLQKQDWLFGENREGIFACKQEHAEPVNILKSQLNLLSGGIPMGNLKGSDFIPHAALALSKQLNIANLPMADTDRLSALNYLRKDNLFFETYPKGLLLLSYRKVPLGWIKNLGNRANNLYPQDWRIRMQIDPEKLSPAVI